MALNPSKDDVVKVVTRTVIGGQVLTNISLKQAHNVLEHSTIQELVSDSVAVPYQPESKTAGSQETEPYDPVKDLPRLHLGYVCIGINGHRNIKDSNMVDVTLPVEHKPTDTGLYRIIPFVIKPLTSDLSDSERARYRLRKILRIEGEMYAAYYLKKLETQNTEPTLILNTVDKGDITSTVWVPTINNLRPTQPDIGYRNDGSFMTVVANLNFTFSEQDVEWYFEAMELLFGHRHYAITELGFCTGADKAIVSEYPRTGAQSPSTAIRNRNLTECVATQVAYFANIDLKPSVFNKGFTLTFDSGITEPLFSTNRL